MLFSIMCKFLISCFSTFLHLLGNHCKTLRNTLLCMEFLFTFYGRLIHDCQFRFNFSIWGEIVIAHLRVLFICPRQSLEIWSVTQYIIKLFWQTGINICNHSPPPPPTKLPDFLIRWDIAKSCFIRPLLVLYTTLVITLWFSQTLYLTIVCELCILATHVTTSGFNGSGHLSLFTCWKSELNTMVKYHVTLQWQTLYLSCKQHEPLRQTVNSRYWRILQSKTGHESTSFSQL